MQPRTRRKRFAAASSHQADQRRDLRLHHLPHDQQARLARQLFDLLAAPCTVSASDTGSSTATRPRNASSRPMISGSAPMLDLATFLRYVALIAVLLA